MSKMLTLKEFLELPDDQKAGRFGDLSDHDRFLWRTQYEPVGFEVVGFEELTEEEKAKADKWAAETLRKRGIKIDRD
jgi:hypothetical protein